MDHPRCMFGEDSEPGRSKRTGKLLMPEEAEYTLEVMLGYLLRGLEAHQKWQKYWKKKDRYISKGGFFTRVWPSLTAYLALPIRWPWSSRTSAGSGSAGVAGRGEIGRCVGEITAASAGLIGLMPHV